MQRHSQITSKDSTTRALAFSKGAPAHWQFLPILGFKLNFFLGFGCDLVGLDKTRHDRQEHCMK